jgi:hypothetical protein
MENPYQQNIERLFNVIKETGDIPGEIYEYGDDVTNRARAAKNFARMNMGAGLDGFQKLDWTMARSWTGVLKIPVWCPECQGHAFPVNFYASSNGDSGWYCDDHKPEGYMKYTNFSRKTVMAQYGDLFEKMAARTLPEI